jgi:predicted nucleotide-binding protein (sugar kinase/HSP70/actin superfamily)
MEEERVKLTYPHMGYLSIPIFNMLTNLGIEVIKAPPISKKTVELGSSHSPEGVCLPYKINMGNFLEGIDRGADTLITICGAGKCRMGFYNAVQKISLAANKDLTFYTLNTDNLFSDLYRFLCIAAPKASRLSVVKNIMLALKALQALDAINDAKNFYGARSSDPEKIIRLCEESFQQFVHCRNFRDIRRLRSQALEEIRAATPVTEVQPAKVVLLGEFYVLMEPYVNHRLENMLVKQGIEVKKFTFTGQWAYAKTLMQTLGLYNEEKDCLSQAKPYFHYHVGGEGLKSVGHAVSCAQKDYDGLIHVYPFGCTPEVVAQYALKNIAQDYELPLLSLSMDEHASDVGLVTRVEAFADCIQRKKTKTN